MIIDNMPNSEYQKLDAVSASDIKDLETDPALMIWKRKCPVDYDKKKTGIFGSAFHMSILEPELFLENYAIAPDAPKNTKAGKAIHEEFQAEHGHKDILTHAEGRQLDFMRGSAMAHPVISKLLDAKQHTERSYHVKHPELGIMMKCRPDLESRLNGLDWMGELKTIDDLDNIAKNIWLFRYHVAAVHYRECYYIEHGKYPDFYIMIFVQKSVKLGRYPCKCVQLDHDQMEKGYSIWEEMLKRYKYCKINDKWPGIHEVPFKPWMK